jgi:hypothetical protein
MANSTTQELTLLVAARQALSAGDTIYADELLEDLETALHQRVMQGHRCEECGRRFRWPGELEHHRLEAHAWRDATLTTFSGSQLSTGFSRSNSSVFPTANCTYISSTGNESCASTIVETR